LTNLALLGIGFFWHIKIFEFSSYILLAGTVFPIPADHYIIHLPLHFSIFFIGIWGGFMNTGAVYVERYFVSHLLERGRGQRIKKFFRETKISHIFEQYPFAILFFSAVSFIPFEPFRLLAITNNYSMRRYLFATFLGRGIRYFTIAVFGNYMASMNMLNVAISIAFIGYLFLLVDKKVWKELWRKVYRK
jgi:membrane protein YqaA with SNARE-associated domain